MTIIRHVQRFILLLFVLMLSFLSRPLVVSLPRCQTTILRRLSTPSPAMTTADNDPVASYLNQPPTDVEIFSLSSFLHQKRRLVVITGAGVSTSSGIPDYRGPQGSYKSGHKPMVHQDFVKSENARKRYWARSMLGWSTFSQARCNGAHFALANLESRGVVSTVITQNVDRLHQKAGSRLVIDLHGRNDRVSCMTCECNLSRKLLQQQIDHLNPSFRTRIDDEVARLRAADEAAAATRTDEDSSATALRAARSLLNEVERRVLPDWPGNGQGQGGAEVTRLGATAETAPAPITPACTSSTALSSVLRADGDAELGISDVSAFVVPTCPRCSTGVLKPDVVFFGDNVPLPRVQDAYSCVEQCDGILVVGTSLEVHSAYRFVERASKSGKQIAILNMGTTRAERQQLPGIVFKSESNCALLLRHMV